jgi:hypothetical protein
VLDAPWLVLTHHLPPAPAYFRVKVGRRLERMGALALKNSVYVLPISDETLEDFQWLLQEIVAEGGEATLCAATFVDGFTHGSLVARFREESAREYEEVARSARTMLDELGPREAEDAGAAGKLEARARRLMRRLKEVTSLDHFDAEGRTAAEHDVARVRASLLGEPVGDGSGTPPPGDVGRGRTWVTRANVKVDRIASAWLIRRFIDPEARFEFASTQGYEPSEGALRFDMFEGEFTHVGDACTFETLLDRFRLDDPALVALGEIVHDIDCKDDKFGRPEAPGVASLVDGIARSDATDDARIARGAALFDDLYRHLGAGTA